MPTWSEILEELKPKTKGEPPQFDAVRKKYLARVHQLTGRNVILYATKWMQGDAPPGANEPWIGLDDMTALECRDLEGIIEAREVGSATGFTIYEMEVVTCRWAGIRYGLPGAPLPSW